MNLTIDQLSEKVSAVFNDQADFDETLCELDSYIANHPDQVQGYRLRAQFNDAAYDQLSAWRDWKCVVALDPQDIDAQLLFAQLQIRWAHRISESMFEEHGEVDSDSDDESDEDEDEDEDQDLDITIEDLAADPREELQTVLLQQEAITSLQDLMHRYVADVAFARRVAQVWDDLSIWQPWQQYESLLTALTAHPHDRELQIHEVKFLLKLASFDPTGDETIPAGFFEDAFGMRYHAFTVEQALDAIDALLRQAPDTTLLKGKADLLLALGDFVTSAQIQLELADFCAQLARDATDPEERESWVAVASQAQNKAEICLQGRAAHVATQFAQMQAAVDNIGAMNGRILPENFVQESARIREDLSQTLQQLQSLVIPEPIPTAHEIEELVRVAKTIAKNALQTVQLNRVVVQPIAPPQLIGGASPWFEEIAPQLGQVGLILRGFFDNPSNNLALGQQCQGQFWTDAEYQSALSAETVKTFRLVRIFSELSDGSLMLTSNSRGTTFFGSGSTIDTFSVDKPTDISVMAALHLARVARRLASNPDLRCIPINSLDRFQDVENRMRECKNALRFSEGIRDIEIRGMHVLHHKTFAELLQAEFEILLEPLRVAIQ